MACVKSIGAIKLASWLRKGYGKQELTAGRRQRSMVKELLVALKRTDRIEDVVPRLEKVAQPGTKVILVIPYSSRSPFDLGQHHRALLTREINFVG